MKFLHLADLHLGWKPGFLPEEEGREIQEERDQVLKFAVDYALDSKNEIDLVIIAGDLFESHQPSQKVIEKAIQELSRLTANNIELVTVPGNHDEITYKNSVYRQEINRWPGYLVTNPMPSLAAELNIDGHQVYIYSLAYTGGVTVTEPPINEFPKEEKEGFHLGIFHGSYFEGSPNWEVSGRSLPLDPKGLAKANYDYLALGHFHKFREFALGKGLAAYAGLIADKGFYDTGTGHLLTGHWQPGGKVQLEKVPCNFYPKFKTIIMDLSGFDDKEALLSRLEKIKEPTNLVQIVFKGVKNFLIDPDWLELRLNASFRYLEIIDNSYYLGAEELERLSQERTITGFFLKRMAKRLKDAKTEEERLLLNQALTKGILALKGGEEG